MAGKPRIRLAGMDSVELITYIMKTPSWRQPPGGCFSLAWGYRGWVRIKANHPHLWLSQVIA